MVVINGSSVFLTLILFTTTNLQDTSLLTVMFRLKGHKFTVIKLILDLFLIEFGELLLLKSLGNKLAVLFKTSGDLKLQNELRQLFA